MMMDAAIRLHGFAALPARLRVNALTPAVWLILLSITFGQRLGFTFGKSQMPLAMPCLFVALGLLAMDPRLRLSANRLALFALAVGVCTFTLLFGKVAFSLPSYLYLVGLYVAFLFMIPVKEEEYRRYVNLFQNLMLIFAAIGILQMLGQMVGYELPSMLDGVPDKFLLENYNTSPVLYYGSTFRKSTGDFFLEPSFLSQFCGIALVLEYMYFRRWWRFAVYGLAIYASFAGTGMLFLLVFAALEMIATRRLYLLLVGGVGFLLLASMLPHSEAILGRVTEYQDEVSSSYARFIGPWVALGYITPDFPSFMLGKGPGFSEILLQVNQYLTFPVITKLILEYGFVTTVPFLIFVTYCFFDRTRSAIFSSCLLFLYLFLTAALLQAHVVLLIYLLLSMMPEDEEAAESASAASPRAALEQAGAANALRIRKRVLSS